MSNAPDLPGEEREFSVDAAELPGLLEEFRPRLRGMVNVRLDPRLHGRLDPSDVIQEAFVDVTRRLDDYRRSTPMPFFLWVRFLVGQKLLELHRRHLGAARRDARREVAGTAGVPAATSISLARALLDGGTSPSGAAIREERAERLRDALERMRSGDREVLVLRHFEHLTNDEAARVLGLTKGGASLRYLQAARRLKALLSSLEDRTGGSGE